MLLSTFGSGSYPAHVGVGNGSVGWFPPDPTSHPKEASGEKDNEMPASLKELPKYSKNIRLLRERKKWTQPDLGRKMGVANTHISKWERGILPNGPSLKHLQRLAEVFGVSVDDILGNPKKVPEGKPMRDVGAREHAGSLFW